MTMMKRIVTRLFNSVLPRTQVSARSCFYEFTNCSSTACTTGGARGTHYYTCCDVDGYGNLTNCSGTTRATCCGA